MTIQIYEIEKPNGKFVLYTDHLDAIIKVNEKAVKQHREAMAEKDAEIAALKKQMEEPPLRRKKRLWSGHFAAQQARIKELEGALVGLVDAEECTYDHQKKDAEITALQATLAEKDREYQTLLSHHEEQMGDSMGKITCLKTTFEEKEREVIKAQRKWSIAMERIAALQAAMEHGCDESNCPMWTNLKNYEKEVDIANDRIKELEDANEMFADLLLKDGTRIQSLKLRNRELTEALEKIATSDEPISDFTQFDEADIRSSTMHMAREIAKQALGGGEK